MKTRAGVCLFAAVIAAALDAFAGVNLIRNGRFEGAGSQDASWGAYANHATFQCDAWEFLKPGRAGLCKPSSTWTKMNAAAIGPFALFIQTHNDGECVVQQSLGALAAGTYRVSFTFSTRSVKNGNVPTYIELVEAGGAVTEVGVAQTEETGEILFLAEVTIPVGTYTFRFRQPQTGTDRANIFEDVVVEQLDARIGDTLYTFHEALERAAEGDTVVLDTDAQGNATIDGWTVTWGGRTWTNPVQVAGVLTFKGDVTLAAFPRRPGTYTLFSAQSIALAEGASVALYDGYVDGCVRTLSVGDTAVTVTVSGDTAPEEMVINGDFDLPGTTHGVNGRTTWSYAYPTGGFAIPYWDYYSTETVGSGNGCGISEANGVWLAANQTNGGRYSFYGQREVDGVDAILRQNFGTTPAGVYRFSFNYATRGSSQFACIWNAKLLKEGTAIHSMKMGEIDNTAFLNKSVVVALGAAGSYGVAFAHLSPNGDDRSSLLDDVHFTLSSVPGWSVLDGVVCLAGTAEVPAQSFVDGDAQIASGATISTYADRFLPSLRVDGDLVVKGPVVITLPESYTTDEGTYKLIEAKAMTLEDGASFSIDPSCRFKDSEADATYNYTPELIVTDKGVVLHLYNEQPTGNNYWRKADERTDDSWSNAANWLRGHTPQSGDANVLFNHPGKVTFSGAYSNSANLYFYLRNGTQQPLVFDATSDEYGYNFGTNNDYFRGAHGSGCAGWVDFRRGAYTFRSLFMNGTGNSGYESVFRLDVSGASLTLSGGSLQCGYSVDALSALNVSAGLVDVGYDYNPNICARTTHRLRVTGGKFRVGRNFQACSGLSSLFDAEVQGGELEVAGTLNVAYTAANSRGTLRVSGGLVRANAISAPAGYGTFIFDGGALAPTATSQEWLNGATLTVAAGKSAVVDTEGKDAVWAATLADDAGGSDFGFAKRGEGTLTFGAAQTFSGPLAVEGGTLLSTVALATGSLAVSAGATFSLADGTPGHTATPSSMALAPGARLAIDVSDSACDSFAGGAIDLAAVTAVNPAVIVANPVGIAELPADREYVVIASGLAPGDDAKFTVNGVDAVLAVKNGALVMTSSNREKANVAWSGAAADGGKWTTGGNWTGGATPQNGDVAVFGLASGGETTFDYAGLSLSGLLVAAGAGEFTHSGVDTLRVTGTVTNESARAQTFRNPVTLGVAGKGVEVYTAGDLVLTGATTIASATLVKTGAGTLAVPGPTALTAARIEVEEGTLRIDERAATVDAPKDGAIVVKDGARLDVNLGVAGLDLVKNEPSRSKTVYVEGEGPDGAGALYNSDPAPNGSAALSRVVLTGDAKVGGSHVGVRRLDESAFPDASLAGPYSLTVDTGRGGTGGAFTLVNANVDLAGLNVSGNLQFEGSVTGAVTNGVAATDGARVSLYATTVPETIPFAVAPDATVALTGEYAASTVNGPLKIGAGATLNAMPTTSSPITFNGAVTNDGTFVQASNGNVYFYGPSLVGGTYAASANHVWFGGSIDSPESEITIGESAGVVIFGSEDGLANAGLPKFRKVRATSTIRETRFMPRADSTIDGGVFDEPVAAATDLYVDSMDPATVVTLKNSTWNIKRNFFLGMYNRSGRLVIGEGATVNAPSLIYTSHDNTAPMETCIEVARGGVLNWTPSANNGFQIGRGKDSDDTTCKPQRVAVTGGDLNAYEGTVLLGVFSAYAYFDLIDGSFSPKQFEIRHINNSRAKWAKAHEELFTQRGGVFALGSGGMRSSWPNWEKPHANLQGGVLRARESFSNKYGYMNLQFGASPADPGEYAIDLNGNTVAWNAPLLGASDVTIQGDGAFTSSAALQSIPLGRWTVAATAQQTDLSGAAGFAGGLTLAPGASAKLSIEGEGLVEWMMFNSDEYNGLDALKGFAGICPYVSATLAHVHLSYGNNVSPTGSNSAFIYRGQFLVEEGKAGTWHFAGDYDDNIYLEIDGQGVFTGTAHNVPGAGSIDLEEGWHYFRVICRDGTGDQGPWLEEWKAAGFGIGWSRDASAAGSTDPAKYVKFDTSTLKMRLPQSAASRTGVRMRVSGAKGTGNVNTFADDGLVYTRLDCVTNTLAGLNGYGGSDNANELQSGTSVRFDGSFYVAAGEEGEWTFYGHYDDRIALDVDGSRVLATTAWGATTIATGARQLTEGWHSFRISAADGSGGWGAYSSDDEGRRGAIRVKRPNSDKTLAFDEANFRIAYSSQDAQKWCRAGLGGVTTLGEGSTLVNRDGVSLNGGCPIYGALAGSGALDGFFRFVGENSAIRVTGAGGRLTAKPSLDDVVNGDCLAGLAKVEADFTDGKPLAARYDVCAAGALTAEEAKAIEVVVTLPGGETADDWSATVASGRLSLVNPHPGGFIFILR